MGTALPASVALPKDKDTFTIKVSADGTETADTSFAYTATMSLGGATLSDYASVVPILQAAIRMAPVMSADQPTSQQLAAQLAPLLSGATVQLVGSGSTAHFRVVAGRGGASFNPLAYMTFSDKTGTSITDLKLDAASSNAQVYSLGITDPAAGTKIGAQKALTGTTGPEPMAVCPEQLSSSAARLIRRACSR